MSCTAIMTKEPVTISGDMTVAHATAMLIEMHSASLPVVDADGCYIGMFAITDLLGLLLPRVALAGDLKSNLRFLSDDPGELRRRYEELQSRSVSEVADRNGARLDPDAPEIAAIRLCFRGQASVPVVETGTDKLIGIISCWDAMRALTGAPHRA